MQGLVAFSLITRKDAKIPIFHAFVPVSRACQVDARCRDLSFSNDFNGGPGREHPQAKGKVSHGAIPVQSYVLLCGSVWRGLDATQFIPQSDGPVPEIEPKLVSSV